MSDTAVITLLTIVGSIAVLLIVFQSIGWLV